VKARRNTAKKAASTSSTKSVDYGLQGEWEAVKDLCLDTNGEIGGYTYSFCFFGELKQGATLIGKFNNWGAIDVEKARVRN
jgi:hypothetical protein